MLIITHAVMSFSVFVTLLLLILLTDIDKMVQIPLTLMMMSSGTVLKHVWSFLLLSQLIEYNVHADSSIMRQVQIEHRTKYLRGDTVNWADDSSKMIHTSKKPHPSIADTTIVVNTSTVSTATSSKTPQQQEGTNNQNYKRQRHLLEDKNNVVEPNTTRLRFQFSLYSPQSLLVTTTTPTTANNDTSSNYSSYDSIIQESVMNSFTRLLCNETDIFLLVDSSISTDIPNSSTSQTILYLNDIPYYDICQVEWNRSYSDYYDEENIVNNKGYFSKEDLEVENTSHEYGRHSDTIIYDDDNDRMSIGTKKSDNAIIISDTLFQSSISSEMFSKVLYQPFIQTRYHTKMQLVNTSSINHNNSSSNSNSSSSNITLSWVTLVVSFPLVYLSDFYINENMNSYSEGWNQSETTELFQMNNNNNNKSHIQSNTTTPTNASSSSSPLVNSDTVKVMQEIIQLAIDIKIVDGTFDSYLHDEIYKQSNEKKKENWNTTLYASPVHGEWNTFYKVYSSYSSNTTTTTAATTTTEPILSTNTKAANTFNRNINAVPAFIVYPMHGTRISGMLLFLIFTILFICLHIESSKRRERLSTEQLNTLALVLSNSKEINKDEDIQSSVDVDKKFNNVGSISNYSKKRYGSNNGGSKSSSSTSSSRSKQKRTNNNKKASVSKNSCSNVNDNRQQLLRPIVGSSTWSLSSYESVEDMLYRSASRSLLCTLHLDDETNTNNRKTSKKRNNVVATAARTITTSSTITPPSTTANSTTTTTTTTTIIDAVIGNEIDSTRTSNRDAVDDNVNGTGITATATGTATTAISTKENVSSNQENNNSEDITTEHLVVTDLPCTTTLATGITIPATSNIMLTHELLKGDTDDDNNINTSKDSDNNSVATGITQVSILFSGIISEEMSKHSKEELEEEDMT